MREMKDSGVEWIGEIPKDWDTAKAKYVFSVVNGATPRSDEPDNWEGNIVWVTPTDMKQPLETLTISEKSITEAGLGSCGTTIVPRGSIVLSTRAPIGKIAYAGVDLCTNQGCKTLVAKKDLSSRFIGYYLFSISDFLVTLGRGTTFIELSTYDLLNLRLPYPTKIQQDRALAYLDVKCEQIDRAIARQQEVIEKLKEYKLSVITEVVTKGLNPDVQMKDSEIEWIGEIPEHWGLPSIKRIARLTSGGTPDRGHPEYWNGEIPWIKTGELKNDFIFDAEEYITELGLQSSSTRVFDANTILMAMYGQGKTRGMTGLLKISAATNQACCGITVNNDIVTVDYLWIFLIGSYEAIRAEAAGSGQPNLNAELIYGFHVTVPPLEEQADIHNFLINIGTKIDSAIKKKEQLIDKLTEYKKSLIYEVVTGKREV